MKHPIRKVALLTLLFLLLAQTSSPSPELEYSRQMGQILGIIFSSLLLYVFPVLIVFGIFKAVLDVFRDRRRMYRPRLMLMLLPILAAQTTTPSIDMARQFFDTIAAYLGIFFAFLLPGFFILLLVKALTKLIKM